VSRTTSVDRPYIPGAPARNFEIGSRSADDPLGNRVVALPLPVVGRLTQFQQGVGFLLLLALHVNEVRPPHALLHAIVAGSKEVPCLGSPVRSVVVVALQEFAGGVDHARRLELVACRARVLLAKVPIPFLSNH
jgi:hypothetical protein